MNKRKFLRIMSAISATPLVPSLFAWATGDKLKNWAGNIDYSTDNLHSASSPEDVRAFIKQQRTLKVLGTRHCFNKIADSSDYFLSLKSMDQLIALNRRAPSVIAAAGVTSGKLSPYLQEK